MYAICSPDPVLAPSKVIPGYPPELEPIVLKALEKDRNVRFKSCDEMLRALDALPQHLRVSSDSDVAAFVTSLFGDKRIEQRRKIEEATTRVEAGAAAGIWPSPDVTSQVTGRRSLASLTNSQELSGLPTGLQNSATRNRLFGVLGLAALAVSGGVLFSALTGKKDGEVRVVEAPVPTPVAVVSAPPAAPTAPPAQASAATVDLDELPTTNGAKKGKTTTTTSSSSTTKSAAPAATTSTPATKAPPKTTTKKSNDFKMDAGF